MIRSIIVKLYKCFPIFVLAFLQSIQSVTKQKNYNHLYKQAGAGKRFFSAPALSMFFYPGYAFL